MAEFETGGQPTNAELDEFGNTWRWTGDRASFVHGPRAANGPQFDSRPTWNGIENLCETAWGIIANAPGWDEDTEWRRAAIRWRDHWHSYMDWASSDVS